MSWKQREVGWKGMMDELMETNIISEQSRALLKRESENYVICDPNTVMNLRHEMVKRNRQRHETALKYDDIMSEAKRMIFTEEYDNLARERDLEFINKEISRYKRQLEIERNNFQNHTMSICHSTALEYKSFLNTKNSAIPNLHNIEQKCLQNNEPLTLFAEKETNNDSLPEIMNCFKATSNGSDNMKDVDDNNVLFDLLETVVEDSKSVQSEINLRKRECIIRCAWQRWRIYVYLKKCESIKNEKLPIHDVDSRLSDNTKPQHCELSECEINTSRRRSRINFIWTQWRTFVNQQKVSRLKTEEQNVDIVDFNSSDNTVNRLIKSIESGINTCRRKQLMKHAWHNWKMYVQQQKLNKCKIEKLQIPKVNIVDLNSSDNAIVEHVKSTKSEFDTSTRHYFIMSHAWQNWRNYVQQQKFRKIKIGKLQINNHDVNVASQYKIKMLRKYWTFWQTVVQNQKDCEVVDQAKKKTEQKIDVFLRTLQQQKRIINSEAKGNIMDTKSKSETNLMKKKTTNFIPGSFSELQMSRIKTAKVHGRNKSELVAKLPHVTYIRNIPFLHRYEAQQQIIATQKSKLEEQSKLIEKMRLAQLKKDAEESAKEAQENLNETLKLKGRGRNVTVSLSTIKDVERPKLNCMGPPRLLVKMTERAKEREKRWQLLKEKKQKIEEEKLQKLEKEREEKAQQEENEKHIKAEELREKRRLQQEIEMEKKKEKQRMHNLSLKATEHYRQNLLKRYGIVPLKRLVILREEQMIVVSEYFNRRLLLKHFYVWKMLVQNLLKQKTEAAAACYNLQLLRKGLQGLFMAREEYVCNRQVACDFYECQLQKRMFLLWHTYTCAKHLERSMQLQKAIVHHNRKFLIRVLTHWKHLPSVMKLEKEKEKRKCIWRQKVQELLPDFRPVRALEETY